MSAVAHRREFFVNETGSFYETFADNNRPREIYFQILQLIGLFSLLFRSHWGNLSGQHGWFMF